MPQIGDIAVLPDGNEQILTTNGWVPNTRELETAAAMGAPGALAANFMEAATFGGFDAGDAYEQTSPVAAYGVTAAELGLAGLGVSKLAGGAMARRVQSRIAKGAAQRQLYRRPSDIAGRATAAGETMRRVEGALEVVPGLNTPLLMQRAANQRLVNTSAAKALGLSDDVAYRARLGLKDDIIDEYLTAKRAAFKQTERAISGRISPLNAGAVLDNAVDSGLVGGKLANQIKAAKTITGREIMQVRSALTDVLQSNAEYMVKNAAYEAIEQIDDIIELALQGTDEAAQFATTRARFRVWANLRKGRNIGKDGQINVAGLDSAFKGRHGYGDNYLAGKIKTGVNEIDDFLQITREGAQLDVGLPSSGTAERSVLNMLRGGGE